MRHPPPGSPARLLLRGSVVLAGFAVGAACADELYEHRIERGDTLIGIAARYLAEPANWGELAKSNRVRNPRRLQPGAVLGIPLGLMRTEPATARVVAVSGEVRSGGEPVGAGASVAESGRLVTGRNGFVTLELPDGSRLRVRSDSNVQLERLRSYPAISVLDARVRVDTGQVDSEVPRRRGPAPRFEIRTPTAHAGVRGTDFRVGTDGRASRTEVLEGAVGVRDAGAATAPETAVAAGFGTLVEAGQPPRPPVPLLQAPDVSRTPALVERTLVRLPFGAVPGAVRYRAQVARGAFPDGIVAEAVSATPEARFADLADGDYTLRTRAIDALGIEGRDAERAFRLKARPEPPFPSQPQTRSTLRSDTVRFVWSQSTAAASYRLQVAADESFRSPVIDVDSIAGTEHVSGAELKPGEYFWRIASTTAGGDRGPFGDPLRFTLRPAPGAPEPPRVDEKSLSFAWPGEPGQTFEFQFARDAQFAAPLLELKLGAATHTMERPGPGVYFMRVRAIDPDGFVGPYTAPQRIEVPPPPPPQPWWLLIPFLLIPFL